MTQKYTAILVDDEPLLISTLKAVLNEFCPYIDVINTANSAFEAKIKIENSNPDIIFLDINMPKVNGLELLQSIEIKTFQTIFVTAYDNYALDALKTGAVDYILKPVISSEVKTAVDKAIGIINNLSGKKEPLPLESDNEILDRIVIHHNSSYMFIELEDVLWLEADKNYTHIYLTNGKVVSASKTLKSYDDVLPKDYFFRVHKSYLINIRHVKEYLKEGKDRIALMKNGHKISVSQPRQPEFKKFLTNIYKK